MTDRDEGRELDRRTFLLELATLGLGAAMLPACSQAAAAGSMDVAAPSGAAIGLQLYTVRDLLEKDFEGTLERVAAIGYTKLEFAGYYGRSPEQVRATLDRLRVSSPSAHIGVPLMRENADAQIRSARTIGQEYITIPSYPFAPGSRAEAWRVAAGELNAWGRKCRDAGLKLAYHNHAPEFAALDGGQTGFEILARETDPALVDFEMDLYWVTYAGQDPLALFARYPGRFTMWHVKDLQVTSAGKAMAPVGRGTIDFRTIFAHAGQSGMRHFFVEHDNAASTGGSLASIETSYRYLRQLLS